MKYEFPMKAFSCFMSKDCYPLEETVRYGGQTQLAGRRGLPFRQTSRTMASGEPIWAQSTQQIQQLLKEFLDVFSDNSGTVQGMMHHIHTPLGWWRAPH